MFRHVLKTCSVFRTLRPNLPSLTTINSIKTVHTSCVVQAKIFVENENQYMYTLLPNTVYQTEKPSETINTLENFNETMQKHYRKSPIDEIVDTFLNVKQFCIDNNINISDKRFDNLVDGLMDQCQDLTDQQLYDLLTTLTELPPCDGYDSHNFHDVWSCLDDFCIWRLQNWDIKTMFKYADLWYKLNLGRISDYLYEVIDILPKKAETLTKDELVHAFFLLNVCRRLKVNFEVEDALEKKINEMNVDEMAIVSLGYFKTKSSIKLTTILQAMLREISRNSKTVHEISLTAILKVIRLSRPGRLAKDIYLALDILSNEVDRISHLAALHLSLVSTSINAFHKKSLINVSNKLIKDINDPKKVRLKDIERLLFALTQSDFNPQTTPDIYQACLEELHSKNRETEIIQYPRSLSCSLHYLSLRGLYSHQLLDKVLDKTYIEDTYGKNIKCLPREIFFLDGSLQVECPDYTGNRLLPKTRYKAAKWHTEFTPSHDQWKKISIADQLILDTIDTITEYVGDKRYLYIEHVLPHFSKADVILCKDNTTNKFVEPIGFTNYVFGDIMVPHKDDNLKWYAVVIAGWNNTIRDTNFPVGQIVTKMRQLEKIGYTPILVIWSEFIDLNKEQKLYYIRNKLK
ncbi:FAST kinase domain-containing protein 5, mitochondrial [Aethina tumida]|uniref:FAST kinase domain-containing protein 5, mitochondrial n=1 Tax=Aethina tumida TaxID=116153 RepID=UPI00096AFC43|nr:FAST kinase domain-containing protein 5, mitochondrial [Aethina tumida]